MKRKNASATVYIIFFLIIFLAFCAFAVDGTIVLTDRAKLQSATEATALAAASQFNASTNVTAQNIIDAAARAFNILKVDNLTTATITTNVDIVTNQVQVNTEYISQPYFLAFLGVTGIELEAKACAVSESRDVTANYPNNYINWITASAAYKSDILSKDKNLNDTAILLPLGNFASVSYSKLRDNFIIFQNIDSEDNKPLSLGPGGFITIKLPVPIVDKPGNDLEIIEAGDAIEGYMVFAGIDNDPANPYVQADKIGQGISWVNITETGTAAGTPKKLTDAQAFSDSDGNHTAKTELATTFQYKFYGSGDFDISKKNISVVKYIRIVDDNDESAYVIDASDNKTYSYTHLYGEASTATAGADIDAVKVLNYVRLKQE